jgi:hypothetical protein
MQEDSESYGASELRETAAAETGDGTSPDLVAPAADPAATEDETEAPAPRSAAR